MASNAGTVIKVQHLGRITTVVVRFDDGRVVRYGTSSSYLKHVGVRVVHTGSALVEAAA